MTKYIILIAYIFIGHTSLNAQQQTRALDVHQSTIKSDNNSSSSLSTNVALRSIAQWISSNPAAALATLGITTSIGYLLYTKARLWWRGTQPARPPMPTVYTMQSRIPEQTGMPHRIATLIPSQQETLQHFTTRQPEMSYALKPDTASESESKERKETGYELLEAAPHSLFKAIQTHYTHNPSAETVIAQYNAGRKVFIKIMAHRAPQLTKDDVRNLIWFFYIRAVATKTGTSYKFFDEGTFRFRGQKEQIDALFNAINSSEVKSYGRMSSHYNEYFPVPERPAWYDIIGWTKYASAFTQYLYTHRGLDIEGLPPRNMGTIVFAKLSDDQMYIKPEPHGTEKAEDLLKHSWAYVESLARKNLPENIKVFIGQFYTLSSDDAENFQKERVPEGVRNKASDFVEPAETILSTTSPEETKKAIKQRKKEMALWGIQQIIPKIADYASDEKIRKADPQLHAELVKYLEELMKLYADWQHRKGNEIIFSMEELLHAPALSGESSS